MIPKECKRLAEVDFPIAEVSRHAAREKSIRHGHPSTLHLWWARRPLASSRSVLMALLMPDPCDPYCPEEFKTRARELLLGMRGRPSGWDSTVLTDEGLRQVILKFIADFANWDNAAKSEYLETSRGLVQAAHPEETPLVVDPFAGGGSIPLEALRLGCEAFASDLNPVACLILKVMLEDIPRHGPGLADELRRAGAEIKVQAEQELAELYPKDPDGATPIAYLWARTVRCEAPNCGAEIPLMRSMWLCRKPRRRWALQPEVVREDGIPPRVELGIFQPQTDREVAPGTVSRARATCVCCQTVLPADRVRSQLAAQNGGADVVFDQLGNRTGGARMTAVVTLKPGQQGRNYRLPTKSDYEAVRSAQEHISLMLKEWEDSGKTVPCPVPDEAIHQDNRGNFWVSNYGPTTFGSLFTGRQKATMAKLRHLTAERESNRDSLSLALSRTANAGCSLCRWHTSGEKHEGVYARQALPMVWDFSEGNPLSDSTGNYRGAVDWIANVVKAWPGSKTGEVSQADAADHPLPNQSAGIWFTDPPYYDAVAYSGLSDFFYAWLKRTLPKHPLLRDPFDPSNPVTPKSRELIVDTRHHSAGGHTWDFYEKGMSKAFSEGRRILNEDGVGSVVFAHKTTEGWEALLSGMIQGGWTITGSWPIATEMGSRLRARDSAALATSIHLICRPRPEDADVGEWSNVLRELPTRVGDWMQRMQKEGLRGADLVFSCIGPALEIYSRYSAVETPDGRKVELPEYLERVWEVVAREALEQVLGTAEAQARNGAAGALEEDARMTALFLWTLQSTAEGTATDDTETEDEDQNDDEETPNRHTSGFSLPFDVARRFAQPLGIHMEEWESRIIHTDKGVVRLRPVADRARELFGAAGADSMADAIESNAASSGQLSLFPDEAPTVRGRARRGRRAAAALVEDTESRRDATTLDRVHAAMLLQASGRTEALRNLIRAEQDRGRTSSGSPTPFPPCTPGAARRSACWTGCCWRRPDCDFLKPPEVKYANRSGVAGAHHRAPGRFGYHGGKPIIRNSDHAHGRGTHHRKVGGRRYGGHPAGTVNRSLPGTRGHPPCLPASGGVCPPLHIRRMWSALEQWLCIGSHMRKNRHMPADQCDPSRSALTTHPVPRPTLRATMFPCS